MGFTGNLYNILIGSTLQETNITMENHYWFPSHGGFLIGKISQITLNNPMYRLLNIQKANWKDPPFLMGQSTIPMAIFNSYVSLPEGK